MLVRRQLSDRIVGRLHPNRLTLHCLRYRKSQNFRVKFIHSNPDNKHSDEVQQLLRGATPFEVLSKVVDIAGTRAIPEQYFFNDGDENSIGLALRVGGDAAEKVCSNYTNPVLPHPQQ